MKISDTHLVFASHGKEFNIMAKKRSGLSIREADGSYGQLNGWTVGHETNIKVEIFSIEIKIRLAGGSAGSVKDQTGVTNTQLDGRTHRVSWRDVVFKAWEVNGPAVLLDVNIRGDGVRRVVIGVGSSLPVQPRLESRIPRS